MTLDALSQELDTIYDEAKKHRDTAGESMRKLRSEYAERLHKIAKLQEMAKAMNRRISGGIESMLVDGESSEVRSATRCRSYCLLPFRNLHHHHSMHSRNTRTFASRTPS